MTTAKDKADFIKAASIAYVAQALIERTKVEHKVTPKVCIVAAIDIAEEHWDDLKRRGYV